jgi:lipopolysaccharide/colanic/teichoic acid biosynthesis glycosyltransferase
MKSVNARGGHGKKPSLSRTLWRSVETLPSREQIERLVAREVARAERNGLHFSLALFRVKRGGRLGLNEKRLALTLLRRTRLTDEVGWFDEEHLCALLPDTSAQGAQIFADAVCDLVARKGPRPICVVYSFPLDWMTTDEQSDGQSGSNGNGHNGHRAADIKPNLLNTRIGLGDLVSGDVKPVRSGPRHDDRSRNGNGHNGNGHNGNGHNGHGHNGNGHANGNGHSDGNGHANGNGNGHRVTRGHGPEMNRDDDGAVAVLETPVLAVAAVPALEQMPSPRATPAPSATPVKPIADLLIRPTPMWKRVIDVSVACLMLVMLSPILAVAALAIKLTSRGPVIFKQRRAGLGGVPFTIYKFRTMCNDAEAKKKALRAQSEQDGPAFKMARDPRITRVGAFLRKTSIDELPQLFNVLKGDMSLVGPRPLPIDEQNAAETWQQRRLDVTPGLTCIWQITGRSQVTFAEWVRMDVTYMRRRTIFHDVAILLKTVPAVLLRRGAR